MIQSFPAESQSATCVTVIIPVFNTAQSLIQRAVTSVLKQSHTTFEVLIVDDGSSEVTADFLDTLAEFDDRIRIVHQSNGGVAAARNTGVRYASGDYIAYLDADDYLESGFLSKALSVAHSTQADVVFGGLRVLGKGGSTKWRTDGFDGNDVLTGSADLIVSACVRALAESPSPHEETPFLTVTNVVASVITTATARMHPFIEGVAHAEDRLYNVALLLGVETVAFCPDVWYVYDTTHEHGVTRRLTPQTATALSRTVLEFAAISKHLDRISWLSDSARTQIVRAAANGTLNYLKLLSGVMSVAVKTSDSRRQLRQLLTEPLVAEAAAHAKQHGWQSRLFTFGARHENVELVQVLGWLWVRRGGLKLKAER